ncbi:hypothetical protein [Aeoliella mucimassa]|uniref:Uncharacterized protein n=1 Tax=Aeoliella mucimassa TaxID=2527972 RepID=A0A518AKP0_9BACT|nr:hypothetical protein [Aeoliella mucimassa]QDU55244.1 hypothetical protein Pan181_14300 [Aeoliella mucimassa]
MKKVLIVVGIVAAVCMVSVLGFFVWLGTMLESGAMPDTMVVVGNKLSSPARKAIDQAVTIRPDESILFFYSAGLWSWNEDGSLVTNQRVISYHQGEEDGELYVLEADYADIESVTPYFSDTWAEDSSLIVELKDESFFMLQFSNEEDLDHSAIDYVLKQVEAQGGTIGDDQAVDPFMDEEADYEEPDVEEPAEE